MQASIKITIRIFIFLMLITACKPELPVTSTITIEMDGSFIPVNKELYGLALEGTNHVIEGGLLAELIQNRSFNENADLISGWRKFSSNSHISIDNRKPIHENNLHSLMVASYASTASGRAGVVAEGYKGIPVRKGHKYKLSFYTRTATSVIPRPVRIALEDSSTQRVLSNEFQVIPSFDWKEQQYTFTANDDVDNAVLTFTTDSSTFFWIDEVSLFHEKTWKNRPYGFRTDLIKTIEALKPSFIRFTDKTFVNKSVNKNGIGFHEILQLCEDLNSEPVYVTNSPDVINNLAYANEPADSTNGALRLANGQQEPFNLKYIITGSSTCRKAIQSTYPDITVINEKQYNNLNRNDWVERFFYAGENFFVSNYNRFGLNYQRNSPGIFISGFSTTDRNIQGTLRSAIAEACFLIAAESNPDGIKKLAYAPLLCNSNYDKQSAPLISFANSKVIVSPSYYLFQMFNENRGDNILKTEVNTFLKPQVALGRAGIELFDNGYEVKDIRFNNNPVTEEFVLKANQRNVFFTGDSSLFNYEFSAAIKRDKGNEPIRIHVRDNGKRENQDNYICFKIGSGISELYLQSGNIKDTLVSPKPFSMENEAWYNVRINCNNDTVRCFIDGSLIHEATLPPLPSLVSIANLVK